MENCLNILLTGTAGFIGSYVTQELVKRGHRVVGLDSINNYYDENLKFDRLSLLGIERQYIEWNKLFQSHKWENFRFIRSEVDNRETTQELFASEKFDVVVHLAAQAGVRYSIENPYAYIQSNIEGFINILEGCRYGKIKHLVYASSSSVYGLNNKVPFSEKDPTSHPVSLYAATKKSNELMAHAYSHLYNIPTTGLRFFTVYGPWGRPDMAPFLFADSILNDKPIKVFNNGNMLRDFTYIDDIVEGVLRCIESPAIANPDWNSTVPDPSSSSAPYRIFNIGNSSPVKLMDFIYAMESACNKVAIKEYLPMQPGDVFQTNADVTALQKEMGYKPSITIEEGVKKLIVWYKKYYNLL